MNPARETTKAKDRIVRQASGGTRGIGERAMTMFQSHSRREPDPILTYMVLMGVLAVVALSLLVILLMV
jgi:hypothetical protein